MNIIIPDTDNDTIKKPNTGNTADYAVQDSTLKGGMSKESLLEQFPQVFGEEVGKLDGKYHIKIGSAVNPVQHAPRRVSVAVRERLKSELDRMQEQEVIAPSPHLRHGSALLWSTPGKTGHSDCG